MKKESSFKDYKKHLKDLKKKGIIKNKKDEAKYWKKNCFIPLRVLN